LLLYGPVKKMASFPETVKVPAELLTGSANVRTSVLKLLGGANSAMTFVEMISAAGPCYKDYAAYDSTWNLEWTFLTEHAEQVGKDAIEADILASFPAATLVPGKVEDEIQSCIDTVLQLRNEALCNALPTSFGKQLDSLAALLANLKVGIVPASSDIPKFGPLHMKVFKFCEFFCRVDLRSLPQDVASEFHGQLLVGQKAVTYEFNLMKDKVSKGHVLVLKELANLRRFTWMLRKEHIDVLADWVKAAIAEHRGLRVMLMDGPVASTAPIEASASSSSASSSSSTALVLSSATAAVHNPSAKSAADKLKANHDNEHKASAMLKLFGGKAKSR
jgi:hypothetical protein